MKYRFMGTPILGRIRARTRNVVAFAWSKNSRRLASCGKDYVIQIFDENGFPKDKFPAKGAELSSATRQRDRSGNFIGPAPTTFTILDMAFSPDATKLATVQSDGIVYVYKLGESNKDKKSVISRLTNAAAVTQIIWESEFEFIYGCADGLVKQTLTASLRNAKSTTFYNGDFPVVALASRNNGTQLAMAFAEGSIAIFSAGNGEDPDWKYTIEREFPAYALVITNDTFLAAGADRIIVTYDLETGESVNTLDFSRVVKKGDHEFGAATLHPNGQILLIAERDKIRTFRYIPRRKTWEETRKLKLPKPRTISVMKWTEDGQKLAVGTVNGWLHMYDTSSKKAESETYEISYVNPKKAFIRIKDPSCDVELTSNLELDILEIKVMGNNQYAVASTMETFIFYDLYRSMKSEIIWPDTSGNEKFYFGNPNVCIVFSNDYFTLIEYGMDETLGTYRTELVNPHVISVRINEKLPHGIKKATQTNKKLAYLTDLRTITIVDLELSLTIGHVTHDSKIDWLELNEIGSKLLFRDIKLRLNLLDVETMGKTKILNNCTFVQWVPESDVVAAQSRNKICIWYDIGLPEQYSEIETRGIAFNVVKEVDKTYLQVRDGNSTVPVYLDESRIEFGFSMENGDLLRALIFIETSTYSKQEKQVMWKQLQKRSLELENLAIYERASAGCNDISKAKYIRDTLNVARTAIEDNVEDHIVQNEIQARVALLKNQVKSAEKSFLQNDDLESCISMYESIHKRDEALRLASQTNHSLLPYLTENYLTHLFESGQEELAADFLQANGNYEVAVTTYLASGIHTKAAKIIRQHVNQMEVQEDWIDQITNGLLQSGFYPEAAEFLAAIGRKKEALDCFKQAKQFDRALQIAKTNFPHLVVELEEEWGNAAFAARQFDEACHHFIESGQNRKALSAAVEARQWDKAMNIIGAIDDINIVGEEYAKLAEHFGKVGDWKKAEHCYAMTGQIPKAIDMYIANDCFEDAYRLANRDPNLKKEVERTLITKAETLQEAGMLKSAEKILTLTGDTNGVISMYAKKKMYDDMLRLVEKYHPSHVDSSRRHVAELLRKDKNFRKAEQYYTKSGDYKEAQAMYEELGQWEDAHRIARDHSGANTAKRVVAFWAESLGGVSGLRLLKRHNCIEDAPLILAEAKKFDFALEVAQYLPDDKIHNVVSVAYARHILETEGDLDKACQLFLNGNAHREAIEMYKKANKLEQAIQVAVDSVDVEIFQDLKVTQARNAFDARDFKTFEACILQATKPELGVNIYKSHGMWTEAFRLCKEYAPYYLAELQSEYESNEEHGGSSDRVDTRVSDNIVQKAREFEKMGEFRNAVECYLKLTLTNTHSVEFLVQCWSRAGSIAVKHLEKEMAQPIITKIAVLLREMQKYSEAAILCIEVDLLYEALDSLIEGNMWTEAKNAAKDFGLEYEQYVVKKHTLDLQTSGRVDELSNVNLNAALEVLAEQGQWDKCLEKARYNDEVLNHYMGLYIKQLIKSREPEEAVKVYLNYGFPYSPAHCQLLKTLSQECFTKYQIEDYENWLDMRNVFVPVVQKCEDEQFGSALYTELETMMFLFHLLTLRAASFGVNGLEIFPTKISMALIRYTNILPAEKYFFEAGQICKGAGMTSMAFVLLNHYMDIHEAIEDGKSDTTDVDYSAFVDTDIPNIVPLPIEVLIPDNQHGETREWVLSASMDRNIQQVLPKNELGEYTASLVSKRNGITYQPCLVTGFPVVGPKVAFRGKEKCANKDDWNRLVLAAKSGQSKIDDCYRFIVAWCGSNPNYSM